MMDRGHPSTNSKDPYRRWFSILIRLSKSMTGMRRCCRSRLGIFAWCAQVPPSHESRCLMRRGWQTAENRVTDMSNVSDERPLSGMSISYLRTCLERFSVECRGWEGCCLKEFPQRMMQHYLRPKPVVVSVARGTIPTREMFGSSFGGPWVFAEQTSQSSRLMQESWKPDSGTKASSGSLRRSALSWTTDADHSICQNSISSGEK
jgi:hypothetical protein